MSSNGVKKASHQARTGVTGQEAYAAGRFQASFEQEFRTVKDFRAGLHQESRVDPHITFRARSGPIIYKTYMSPSSQ